MPEAVPEEDVQEAEVTALFLVRVAADIAPGIVRTEEALRSATGADWGVVSINHRATMQPLTEGTECYQLHTARPREILRQVQLDPDLFITYADVNGRRVHVHTDAPEGWNEAHMLQRLFTASAELLMYLESVLPSEEARPSVRRKLRERKVNLRLVLKELGL